MRTAWWAVIIAVVAGGAAPAGDPGAVTETVAALSGTWAGTLTHDGESTPVALTLDAVGDSAVVIRLSLPVIHLDHTPVGRAKPEARGDSVRIGPFRFAWDRTARTLRGTVPNALIPVYAIPVELRRVERFDMPARPALTAPEARPLWSFDAGAPLWAGPVFEGGTVFVGAEDGAVHALDARTGAPRWSARTGARVRTRPAVHAGVVYVPSDDGKLYALGAADGAVRWSVRIVEKPIVRLPFDRPDSRFDRFGSDVAIAGERLYVGTHDGTVLCLDRATGARRWSFAAGDAVLAAPLVADGRVIFGSMDRHVYALDTATGALQWKRDTQGAVVSTPALAGGRAVVGTRAYDLLGLDPASGAVAWKRYVWMSWIESSATIRDGVAYVGSSDAAALFAFDARSGARRWATDVHGWAWGQPAVGARRVYTGTSSQVGYPSGHAGGLLAIDRATGAVAWRYAVAAPDSGAFGFPGSPALGDGRVYASGLDGRVVAFAE
jgi:outer membrane protein assembly factor BamB